MIETTGMKTTRIQAVEARGHSAREWFLIRDIDGQGYSTRNMWQASLCDQARLQGLEVRLWSSAGWYYRDLDEVRLVDDPKRMAKAANRNDSTRVNGAEEPGKNNEDNPGTTL